MLSPESNGQSNKKNFICILYCFSLNRYHSLRGFKYKKAVSPKRKEDIEADLVINLELLCGKFEFNVWDPNDQSNAEETHFMVDMDNGIILRFAGEL